MDHKKIGAFMKALRKEKQLTQEQFAEKFNVSNRTVSRWENGDNLPLIDVLVQISDFYGIDISELLDGERKCGNMDKEIRENVLKAAEYSNAETLKQTRKINILLYIGTVFWLAYAVISRSSMKELVFMKFVSDFSMGMAIGISLSTIIATSRYSQKILEFKRRILNALKTK